MFWVLFDTAATV